MESAQLGLTLVRLHHSYVAHDLAVEPQTDALATNLVLEFLVRLP